LLDTSYESSDVGLAMKNKNVEVYQEALEKCVRSFATSAEVHFSRKDPRAFPEIADKLLDAINKLPFPILPYSECMAKDWHKLLNACAPGAVLVCGTVIFS
jgi:hypothetical protein